MLESIQIFLKNKIDRAGSRSFDRSFFSRSLSDPIGIAIWSDRPAISSSNNRIEFFAIGKILFISFQINVKTILKLIQIIIMSRVSRFQCKITLLDWEQDQKVIIYRTQMNLNEQTIIKIAVA